jgi:hypothetical protein
MIDVSNWSPTKLLRAYEAALQDQMALVARRRSMTPANTDPDVIARTDAEIEHQAAWVGTLENQLRKRGMLK